MSSRPLPHKLWPFLVLLLLLLFLVVVDVKVRVGLDEVVEQVGVVVERQEVGPGKKRETFASAFKLLDLRKPEGIFGQAHLPRFFNLAKYCDTRPPTTTIN